MPKPVPFYPELECHLAPLPAGEAPVIGCDCPVCGWARTRALHDSLLEGVVGPILPGTPAWDALLEAAR